MADDVLAVLDELGLERVKLVGHDWGGWIGFLLALKAPERFDRYLALNILHPWIKRAAMLPHLWRFLYQWVILTPGSATGSTAAAGSSAKSWSAARPEKDVWDERTLSVFADNLAEPDHARPAVQMYRVFNLREIRPIVGGQVRGRAPHRPDPASSSAKTTSPCARPLLAGYEHHADEMRVELVPDCGHFIADERPELVAERAREFFSAPIPQSS